MRVRIWPILVVGFGALVALVALSGWLALVRATSAYAGISTLHDAEHRTGQLLTELRSDIAVSAILVRDSLLDPQSANAIRAQLERLRGRNNLNLEKLTSLVPEQQTLKLALLRREVNSYWQSIDPLFTAEKGERALRSFAFVQTEIVPRRQAALRVVEEIEALNAEAFRQRRREIDSRNAGLAVYVERMVILTLLTALVVAGISIFRIYSLERVAFFQHEQVKRAEGEMRRLSRQLVSTQEEERRALSRDLHDQVGQVLTALRISLGNLSLLAGPAGVAVEEELELAKRLLGQVLRSTHDLAMGLRPSMLDDLGLGAALEWQARQHGKVCGVPVSLAIEGSFQHLSDAQRTCVYRVVQEALNNTAKHAQAQNIDITIASFEGSVRVSIQDDGVGFEPELGPARGLGLVGMKERVAQLDGELTITSRLRKGTLIVASFPALQ